jgi:hypothetical protein
VWNIEYEVVEIIAMSGIIPPHQALINIIDITNEVWERLTDQLDLWNVRKNIWVGTEIDMLRGTVRLYDMEYGKSDIASPHRPSKRS